MGMKCIGVDVGGTSVKMGIFETTGELLDKWEVKTRKEENGKYILPDVAASIREKVSAMGLDLKTDIAGAGLGVPGPVMPDGSVEVCVNLGWKNVNPQKELSALLDGIPVKSGNDANVAALGEMWQGGGKGYDNLVMITLGTGVGGGVILDQKIVAGRHGLAGEIGHIHVRDEEKEYCNCGGQGCLEQICSATGIMYLLEFSFQLDLIKFPLIHNGIRGMGSRRYLYSVRMMIDDNGIDRVTPYVVVHIIHFPVNSHFLHRPVFQNLHFILAVGHILYFGIISC